MYRKLRIILGFVFFLIASESKALTGSIRNSISANKLNGLDKRITDVRKKIKEQLKDENSKETIAEFRKYSHDSDWVNWTNWGNWNNWNNWHNWDNWANWSNQWSNFLNS